MWPYLAAGRHAQGGQGGGATFTAVVMRMRGGCKVGNEERGSRPAADARNRPQRQRLAPAPLLSKAQNTKKSSTEKMKKKNGCQ